jgi:hypothetical protein
MRSATIGLKVSVSLPGGGRLTHGRDYVTICNICNKYLFNRFEVTAAIGSLLPDVVIKQHKSTSVVFLKKSVAFLYSVVVKYALCNDR